MKRSRRTHLKLADVIRVVSEFCRNDYETAVVVNHLIQRGVIRFCGPTRHHKPLGH
ncbi:MAG: hypothetical protein N3B01_12080 [Verrucomicrobiae bacterium]|nr:hypothetical protein [Verrucomicrobiae bacterium]